MKMQTTILLTILACGQLSGVEAPSVIPRPVEMRLNDETFELTTNTRILYSEPVGKQVAEYLASVLKPATGFDLEVGNIGGEQAGSIMLSLSGAPGHLGKEGYHLIVSNAGVNLRAKEPAGLFYGCQTLRQLFPAEILKGSKIDRANWKAVGVEILDEPVHSWRGLMLDVSRHFLSVEYVKQFMDWMALHKINTLHLHLTDDQGWRIEIKKYPLLTQIGAVRAESPLKGNRKKGDGTPYGPFFYSQEQIRELVAYAAERHITLVPEIEMPGHARAALAAYPELSCTGGPFTPRTSWGIEEEVYCAGNDKVLEFNQEVLKEVMELFPSKFIHVGGDECRKTRWDACAKCKQRIEREGLKDSHELQSWFIGEMEKFLSSHGRRLIGWDEILEGGLSPGATVMSWRGVQGGISAAKMGHDVVMSPKTHCYLDYNQSKMPGEPEGIGQCIPLPLVYSYEPVPRELTAEESRRILGVQGNLWAEYFFEPKDLEYFAFPRACALAEVAWTPAKLKNFPDFVGRLEKHGERLKALGINSRILTPDQTKWSKGESEKTAP